MVFSLFIQNITVVLIVTRGSVKCILEGPYHPIQMESMKLLTSVLLQAGWFHVIVAYSLLLKGNIAKHMSCHNLNLLFTSIRLLHYREVPFEIYTTWKIVYFPPCIREHFVEMNRFYYAQLWNGSVPIFSSVWFFMWATCWNHLASFSHVCSFYELLNLVGHLWQNYPAAF